MYIFVYKINSGCIRHPGKLDNLLNWIRNTSIVKFHNIKGF